jgi:hypothetical protein
MPAGVIAQRHATRRHQRLVVDDGQHGVRDVEVVVAGLASREVQLQAEGAQGIVAFACFAHGCLGMPDCGKKIQLNA